MIDQVKSVAYHVALAVQLQPHVGRSTNSLPQWAISVES